MKTRFEALNYIALTALTLAVILMAFQSCHVEEFSGRIIKVLRRATRK